jgi:hypothetical protein
MRPAHCLDSTVSDANRQGLSTERIDFEERRSCPGQDSSSAKSLQNDKRRLVARLHLTWFLLSRSDRLKRSRPHLITFANSGGQCQEALTKLKTIAVVITATFLFGGCSWFGPAEQYKTESGRTTYRAGEENPATRTEITSAPQKIPGESKKASSDQQ